MRIIVVGWAIGCIASLGGCWLYEWHRARARIAAACVRAAAAASVPASSVETPEDVFRWFLAHGKWKTHDGLQLRLTAHARGLRAELRGFATSDNPTAMLRRPGDQCLVLDIAQEETDAIWRVRAEAARRAQDEDHECRRRAIVEQWRSGEREGGANVSALEPLPGRREEGQPT